MKFSSILSTFALGATALAAPVESSSAANVPAEAVLGYLDLDGAKDVALLPFANTTHSGILFVNTTIYNAAAAETDLSKREASADAWHWLQLDPGQPIYKREASADAWHWLQLDPGQPIYKREASADAWHWLQLDPGQPIYKREASADAWHWLQLDPGQPIY